MMLMLMMLMLVMMMLIKMMLVMMMLVIIMLVIIMLIKMMLVVMHVLLLLMPCPLTISLFLLALTAFHLSSESFFVLSSTSSLPWCFWFAATSSAGHV